MRRVVGGWLLAGGLVLVAQGAQGGNLSVSLKNFYTEYEVVKQCLEQSQLPPDDAASAEAAITKIELHYLQRDASINKDHLRKEAVANKDEGFRIATRGFKVNLKQYCRVSLNELLAKAKEIGADPKR